MNAYWLIPAAILILLGVWIAYRALPKRPVRTHDYTRRGWGHNVELLKVHNRPGRFRLVGWGNDPQVGDFVLFSGGRYEIRDIEHYRDPADMWTAEVVRVPLAVDTPNSLV